MTARADAYFDPPPTPNTSKYLISVLCVTYVINDKDPQVINQFNDSETD